MQMEENEKIADFFNRVISHTNSMKACGETMTVLTIVEKILRTLSPKFYHIVVAIEESRKIDELKLEDLQGSLEAHEQRISERSANKAADQALQAMTSKKSNQSSRNGNKGKWKGKDSKKNSWKYSNDQDSGKTDSDVPESSNKKGGFKQSRGKKKVDKKKLKC